jgi:lysophospholipase L1-like esterase
LGTDILVSSLKLRHRIVLGAVGVAAVLAAVSLSVQANSFGSAHASRSTTGAADPRWIAAWGAAPDVSQVAPANSSVRNIARISVTGTGVRVRVANPKPGSPPLVIGSASIALQEGTIGAGVVPGSIVPLTFDGSPGITIPPWTDAVYSDPVPFAVEANQNVAVTISLPSAANPDVGGAQWNSSYVTAANGGDQTRTEAGSRFGTTIDTTYALTAIDVLTTHANGAIVALGSSTMHGFNSTRDGYDRVLDLYIERNQTEVADGNRKGIVAAAVGGDTVFAAQKRLQRDTLSQSGVSAVILWATNDLATRTAAQVILDYKTIIRQSHDAGVEVYCPTWAPRALPSAAVAQRSILNEWITNSGECDDTVDWDSTLRSTAFPNIYKPEYISDGVHANAAGHAAMSAATPLRWFTGNAR